MIDEPSTGYGIAMVIEKSLEQSSRFGHELTLLPVERRPLEVAKHSRVASVNVNHKPFNVQRKGM